MSPDPDDPCGLTGLAQLVPHAAVRAPGRSSWTVGQHVEHCVLATLAISRLVRESSPPVPPVGFAWRRRILLATGRIPRGRARAPEAVVPTEELDPDRLGERVAEAVDAVAALRAAAPDGWFRHFVLGPMDRDTSLRFVRIHNRHHERIAREVLAHAPAG